MTRDELRKKASDMVKYLNRGDTEAGWDSTYLYKELIAVRDNTVDKAVELAEDTYDMTELARLPDYIRSLKEE